MLIFINAACSSSLIGSWKEGFEKYAFCSRIMGNNESVIIADIVA